MHGHFLLELPRIWRWHLTVASKIDIDTCVRTSQSHATEGIAMLRMIYQSINHTH
jgi:hypothetical protein